MPIHFDHYNTRSPCSILFPECIGQSLLGGTGINAGIVSNAQTSNDIPSFKIGLNGNKWDAGILAANKRDVTDSTELLSQLRDYDSYVAGVSIQA